MKIRHITTAFFLVLSIISYKYIALHDEGITTPPVELSSKTDNQNKPAEDTSNKVFQESNMQVVINELEESNDIQQEYKFKIAGLIEKNTDYSEKN